MEVTFSQLDDTVARFVLSGATHAFANTLRRAMISEVPTLAIENVRIYGNTSALFDEMLAHRLGLIPLKTDLSVHTPVDSCACGGEGCPGCTVIYTLSVEGPRTVYSSDLIPQDPEAVPVHGNIPVVKLADGQKLVLEAQAVINKGKEHAKWQPTVACGYKNYPVITISEDCDGCGMCVEECPRGILAVDGGAVSVIDGRLADCSMCRLCEQACLSGGIGEEPGIRIAADETRFIFVVESDGSLPASEIIKYALLYVKDKSHDLVGVLTEISGGIADEEGS